MERMVRKQVYIGPAQERRLKRLARETGLSEAELIRRALDEQIPALSAAPDGRAWERERRYILRRLKLGPLPGGRAWTRDELHDR